jgi:hypothetical protein
VSQRVLVTFIDAFGPRQLEVLAEVFDFLPYRRALTGTMGYSSGALPTILTGASPAVHGRMCLFSAPARERSGVLSPLSWLGLLPRIVHERGRVRSLAARVLARTSGLTGYVALHRVPPAAFRWLDIPEREDMFRARDIGGAPTFLADARRAGLDVYAAPWQLGEEERWQHAQATLAARQPRLTFLYAGALDGALHRHGNQVSTIRQVGGRIAREIGKARTALSAGLEHGVADVLTLVVGDHGMADVDQVIDPRPALQRLAGQRLFVDSTMMRFWGTQSELERARLALERLRTPGIWLDRTALGARDVPTRDAPYGDAIFVLDEGVLFAPSFLGGRVRGMHGYDTACASANAALASDHEIPASVGSTAALAPLIRRALGLLDEHQPAAVIAHD